jgi:muramoyltetrapeptide carboxypeptidase LdcA involved in peptidoglycan recycling
MIRPRRLQPGDHVAAVSLSWGGPAAFPHRYAIGKRQCEEEFGVRVLETPHALRDDDWLRRNPRARADDLMGAFRDPSIAGIISTIGGDDSIRLLPYLDLDVIRAHPKVFLGYSDTTVSHLACFRAGLVSFYGPAFMSGFAENGGMFPYMVDAVRRACFTADSVGRLTPASEGWTVERLDWADPANQQRRRQMHAASPWRFLQGTRPAEGVLFGGCLEVLDWLRGTVVWPDAAALRGAILFLETSEEAPAPSAVARALRSYASMGILHGLSGLLFGRPGGSQLSPERFEDYDRAILDVVAGEERLHDLPVVTRMDFGHTDPMCVLPYGVRARIDPVHQTFEIVESAVTE